MKKDIINKVVCKRKHFHTSSVKFRDLVNETDKKRT